MKVAIYVPHGVVRDKRGFAPAIVAWNHARRSQSMTPFIISAREHASRAKKFISMFCTEYAAHEASRIH